MVDIIGYTILGILIVAALYNELIRKKRSGKEVAKEAAVGALQGIGKGILTIAIIAVALIVIVVIALAIMK